MQTTNKRNEDVNGMNNEVNEMVLKCVNKNQIKDYSIILTSNSSIVLHMHCTLNI